jgi:pyridoxamine 5'-phosphate oxidase
MYFSGMSEPKNNPADLRIDYRLAALNEADTALEPIAQFEQWFNEAMAAEVPEPNAMFLATASELGQPSGRVVLLKGFDNQGFVFYTNYASRKGQHLDQNPHCALTFLWHALERQVRIEGVAAKVSAEQSAAYFHSRPRGSQLGAWASPQSQVMGSRTELETLFTATDDRFADTPAIDLPPFWGGYCVVPRIVEFWQGRTSRLHDRIVYERTDAENWVKYRLAP